MFNDVIFFCSEIDALKHRRPIRNSNTQQLSYLSYRMSAAVYKPGTGTGTVPTSGQSRPSLWLSYFISAILDCLIGLLSVSRGLISITLHWQRLSASSDAADAIKDAFGMRVNCLWMVTGLCLSHAVKPSYRGWRTTTSFSRHHTSSSVFVVPKPKLPINTP